ncbi:alpha/beta-hydrolase [Lentinus tigrinus ALCF2SS1-6]|uniref:Alpha/beta-hydrolase n=1 Tax=Lentinus tigrinus ALCF2SS1-6 TaxID=1328759 RepID=A0A5C2SI34_9APHY|nr:alpha/beta-hydrolase [Lentinus tigrinus ALCF2SS1-6]
MSCTALGFEHQFVDPNLLADFHVVRYELRGHGRSDKPLNTEAYESVRFAEDFKTVCDAFGLNKPFLWMWSLGGTIAVDVIAAYGPEYLSGLLYIGGGVLSTSHIETCIQPSLGALIPTLLSDSSDDMTAAAEGFVDSAVGTPLPYSIKLQWMGGFIAQPRATRNLHISRLQPHEVWQAKAKAVPVLIINGKEDQHCVYENMIAIARTVYDDIEVKLLDGVGHSPHFESPAEVNALVRAWTNRVLWKGA